MMQFDLSPGDELPPMVRQTGFPHWNRYAAVNDEFIPIHMDDEAAREAGFPIAIGMGNLVWSYFHNMLRDWMGEGGRIEKIAARYWQPNLRDSILTLRAKVVDVSRETGAARVTFELLAQDAAERRLATGEAVVRIAAPAAL
jgi:acyl dehydratase